MCDFAADAAAAEQLMVGRTLSVARVRELNAKDYFYQMLKDNPEMLKIYPGIENELLQGAIDCHIHAFPDFVHRSQDMIQIAIEASKCGMRADRLQRPLEYQRDVGLSDPAAHRRYDRPRRVDQSRRSLWRRRDVFRDEARVRPRGTSVSQLQDDLVPDFHVLWFLARRRSSGKRRRAPVQRGRQGFTGGERDHGDGGREESRHRLRPYRFSGAAAVGSSSPKISA